MGGRAGRTAGRENERKNGEEASNDQRRRRGQAGRSGCMQTRRRRFPIKNGELTFFFHSINKQHSAPGSRAQRTGGGLHGGAAPSRAVRGSPASLDLFDEYISSPSYDGALDRTLLASGSLPSSRSFLFFSIRHDGALFRPGRLRAPTRHLHSIHTPSSTASAFLPLPTPHSTSSPPLSLSPRVNGGVAHSSTRI